MLEKVLLGFFVMCCFDLKYVKPGLLSSLWVNRGDPLQGWGSL